MPSRAFLLARRLLSLPRRAGRLLQNERRAVVRGLPVLPDTVFYESFDGNGALDNPEAIFRALIDDPEFATLRHIWAVEPASSTRFRAEFARHPRVRFVRPRTVAYTAALARSSFLINNATFPPDFQKRDGQRYLNTWHGTPLKRMGYDMLDGAFASSNVLRNFVMADLLLSQGPPMTRMYTDSYRLAGILPGTILEAGYPRTDRQQLDASQRATATAALQDAGIDIADRTLVVYAPTWKGTDFGSPRDEAATLLDTTRSLQGLLGDDHLVLLKVHQSVAHSISADDGVGILIPNEMPTNVVLGLADVLVTDYSSIFVDFLGTGRPVVFYTPDRAEYGRDRGIYAGDDQLPGMVAATTTELAQAILAPASDPVVAERVEANVRAWRAEYVAHDDGHATARVIDAFFQGAVDPEMLIAPTRRRPSVLLYLGGMRSNGITTSALNLIAHLDHDALEVSVLMARPGGRQQRANAARIDSRVRQFHRRGGLTASQLLVFPLRVLEHLRARHREREWERRLWAAEWRRCLGDTSFDTVIDFSGYGRFWAQLVLHSPPARRLIWLHNDMVAEVDRRVLGRRRMRRSLPAVFALYPRFDALVSVSRDLAAVNADSLGERYGIPRSHFLSAGNVIDATAGLRMLRLPLAEDSAFIDPETGEIAVPDWVERLMRKQGTSWFATVGRLSPEKNQVRLLDAFAIVHAGHPSTRLVIVGDGPLRPLLEERIAALGLRDVVLLTGALANPFAVLALADCFVLSSDYEGQPMVLLEAAVAQLPIVTVSFGSVNDALPGDELHIAEQNVESLAAAMNDYLAGRVRPATLGVEEYNARVLREFVTALESELSPSSDCSSMEVPISASNAAPTRTTTASAITTTTTPIVTNQNMRASSAGSQPRRERL